MYYAITFATLCVSAFGCLFNKLKHHSLLLNNIGSKLDTCNAGEEYILMSILKFS